MLSLLLLIPLTVCATQVPLEYPPYRLPPPALWNSTCNANKSLSHPAVDEVYLCPVQSVAPPPPSSSSPSPSPWTQEPLCLPPHNPNSPKSNSENETFCVYTLSTFANGRGISLLTTPRIATILAHSPAFRDPAVTAHANIPLPIPPFTIQPLPGHGMSVVMNRTVHRGDILFLHTPVVVINRRVWELYQREDIYPFERRMVELLPQHAREMFMALHGHSGNHEDDKIHTNSFQVNLGGEDDDAEPHNVVLPETSRMNHDCRPNAHYYFDITSFAHHVHAIRTIHSGEELTISYTDSTRPREERQAAIQVSWGFPCDCSHCNQLPYITAESDNRLLIMHELEEILGTWNDNSDSNSTSTPVQATPEMAETLIELYRVERLHAPIALAYTYASLTYCALGRKEEAVRYALLGIEAVILNSGPQFEDVDALRAISDDIEDSWCWRKRVKTSSTEKGAKA